MKPSSVPNVRFAVIGSGLIGPRHARTVEKNSSCDLVAIVDLISTRADLVTELGVAYYKSVTVLIQSPHKPDAAIICTPNHAHVPIAKEFSSADIHILIEKPVSIDIPSGQELLEHLKTTGIKAPSSLGKAVAINGLWVLYKPLPYFDPPAEWKRHNSSGGVVLINMIHEVDLLHYLFGPIITVQADKMISQRDFGAEEGAALPMRFESGVVGSILVSDNLPSPYNFKAGTGENRLIPHTGQDFYRIFGTDASLSIPDMTLWSYRGHRSLGMRSSPLDHFIKVIRGEETPSCTAQTGYAALLVCQAIKKALEAGTTVQVELFKF